MEPVAIVLSSLKSAIDIAKALRSADVSIERAELKLKLADLMEALADAKLELTEVEAELAYKSDEIKRLTEALETRGDVIRFLDAVYMKGSNGLATGTPYCLACWSDKHLLRPLVEVSGERTTHCCTSCRKEYTRRLTPRDADYAQRAST
jgi:hypothetical protein